MDENIVHCVEANAHRLGDEPALVWDDGGLTWRELERRACGFARHLATRSVGPGDRIAILIPNRWTFAVALLGGLKVGATVAPLIPDLKPDELADVLADLRPKCLIEDVEVDEGPWATAAQSAAPAVIVYTSGSTGRPKGAVFSHQAVLFGTRLWGEAVMRLEEDDVVLGALPFSHNYGMYAGLLAPLLFGATTVLIERFTPEAVFAAIKKNRVTIFPGVATMFHRLLASPHFSDSDLSSLRIATSGAAPCAPALCGEWRENTGVSILCGYGATEVPRSISFTADDLDEPPGTAGKVMPGVEIRAIDEEGRPLSDGEVGELWIKSPAAMDGYLGRPDETREVLSDGWYRSGDLGAVLPGGFIRIIGRKRERILRGGFSVFPQEVEAVLLSHPAIAEAAVAGVLDTDLGEEIAAFVTLQASARATADEIIAYCKERLARYKYPRKVMILNDLPKSPMGKVLKAELLKRYANS
ncbi:MAG TPA: AMP-binding protein [Verrucomicrobiae bacterium]|nr:AMP-binding protein [Verrucomicrobiae bacterium]